LTGKSEKTRTINIAILSEAELLELITQYVTSMNKFAISTRNVHREIKDTLSKTCMLLTQYKIAKDRGHTATITDKPVVESTGVNVATQTLASSNAEKPDPSTTILENIQEQLATQQRSIDQLLAERSRQLQPEQSVKQQKNKKQNRNQQQKQQGQHQSPTATTVQRNDWIKRFTSESLKDDENNAKEPKLPKSYANAAMSSEDHDPNTERRR